MQEKYTYDFGGAGAGAVLQSLFHVAIGTPKVPPNAQARFKRYDPRMRQRVMADPAAAAELKVKRTSDYDDVVRDHLKRVGDKADRGYQFNRECGRAIEALIAKTASKS
jgi:hypothetical protein